MKLEKTNYNKQTKDRWGKFEISFLGLFSYFIFLDSPAIKRKKTIFVGEDGILNKQSVLRLVTCYILQ